MKRSLASDCLMAAVSVRLLHAAMLCNSAIVSSGSETTSLVVAPVGGRERERNGKRRRMDVTEAQARPRAERSSQRRAGPGLWVDEQGAVLGQEDDLLAPRALLDLYQTRLLKTAERVSEIVDAQFCSREQSRNRDRERRADHSGLLATNVKEVPLSPLARICAPKQK